jgi:hypothetical protein
MSKINLGLLELDLNQVVNAVRGFTNTDLDIESKNAVNKMIEEVRKLYDMIIGSLLPFYNVIQCDDATYPIQFTSQFVVFKQTYFANLGELSVHCNIIKSNLDELLKKRNWLSKLPHIKDSLQNLENLAEKWKVSRATLEYSLEEFLSSADRRLGEIDELSRTQSIKESRNTLQALLKESDQSIRQIKAQLNDLKIISSKLA